jgi:protein-disulfide isomerase
LKAIALQAGFTEESFTACLNNQDVAKNIFEVRSKGEGFGITGIPTFFINGVRYKGDYTYDAMKIEIDKLLA